MVKDFLITSNSNTKIRVSNIFLKDLLLNIITVDIKPWIWLNLLSKDVTDKGTRKGVGMLLQCLYMVGLLKQYYQNTMNDNLIMSHVFVM